MCIILRNGIKIWVKPEVAEAVMKAIEQDQKLVRVGGNFVNTVDITAVVKPEVVSAWVNEKRGLWQTKGGDWVTKKEGLGLDNFADRVGRMLEEEEEIKKAESPPAVKRLKAIR